MLVSEGEGEWRGSIRRFECVPITPYSILDLEACTALYIVKGTAFLCSTVTKW